MVNLTDNTDLIFDYGFFGWLRNLADGFVSLDAQLMQVLGDFTELDVEALIGAAYGPLPTPIRCFCKIMASDVDAHRNWVPHVY